jgi:hypothetical protein
MLVDHGRRLGAAVTLGGGEIEGGNAMLAQGALERGAAIDRLGSVISHVFSLVLYLARLASNGCATLGWNLSDAPENR